MAVRGIYQPPITSEEGVQAHGDAWDNYLRMLGAEFSGGIGELEGLLRSLMNADPRQGGVLGTTVPGRISEEPALPTVEEMAEITGGDPDAPGAGLAMATSPDPTGPLGDLVKSIMPALAIIRQAKGPRKGVSIYEQPGMIPGSKVEKEKEGYYHEISGQSPDTPLKDKKPMRTPESKMESTRIPDPDVTLTPRERFPLQDLEGKWVKGSPWDRSGGGEIITHVQGEELPFPVSTQGGFKHMELRPDAPMASMGNIMPRYSNFGGRKGKDAIVAPVLMGHKSSDFNRHVLDQWFGQMANRGFKTDVLSDFVGDVNKRKTLAGKEPWKGFTPEGYQQLLAQGDYRTALYEVNDLKKYREMNFPETDTLRHAQTDPEFMDMTKTPLGQVGHGYARVSDTLIPSTNRSYSTEVEGEALGRTETMDWRDMWPDFIADRRAAGLPEKDDWFVFGKSGPEQQITEALIRNWQRKGIKVD